MRIISNFHDYYDSAIPYDVDSDTYYIRNSNKKCETGINEFKFDKFGYYARLGDLFSEYSINSKILIELIGFCGKIYYKFYTNRLNLDLMSEYEKLHWAWYDIETIIPEIINYTSSKTLKKQIIKEEKRIIKGLESFKTETNAVLNSDFINKLSIKYNCPYFMFEPKYYSKEYKIYPNFDSLKTAKFYKVLNATQTYQEIDMYLNSVLTINKEVSQITDNKVLCEAKGFDLKTSFRHPVK